MGNYLDHYMTAYTKQLPQLAWVVIQLACCLHVHLAPRFVGGGAGGDEVVGQKLWNSLSIWDYFIQATHTYLIDSPSYLESFLLRIFQNILRWMFKGAFIECFLKSWWNYVKLQALRWKCTRVIKHEYLPNYHKSVLQTHIYCDFLTIFRRISHLLGEELAKITLCDDKTSRSGSSMLINGRYLPGVAWETQKAWPLR